jgi:hypothetical protein
MLKVIKQTYMKAWKINTDSSIMQTRSLVECESDSTKQLLKIKKRVLQTKKQRDMIPYLFLNRALKLNKCSKQCM